MVKWASFFQVSRSGYHSYLEGFERHEQKKELFKIDIKRIFTDSGGTYGPDRICGVLRKNGLQASYKKISGYMSEMGLQSVYNRHRTRSLTDSRNARCEKYCNLVYGHSFDLPYQAVCSDITYLRSREGWLYLCTVKGIVTGEILGDASSDKMKKELVIQAFLNAQARHGLTDGTIFHSDRGSQYTSKDFMSMLELYGIKQSFSRVGMACDNA